MVNSSFKNFIGKKANNMIGKTDYEVFPKNHTDFFAQKDRELLNNKSNLFNYIILTVIYLCIYFIKFIIGRFLKR